MQEQERQQLFRLLLNLVEIDKNILLAPTGAAKVIANYSSKPAFTIHKKIYFRRRMLVEAVIYLQQNKHKTLFYY
jgi:hypothetical protein